MPTIPQEFGIDLAAILVALAAAIAWIVYGRKRDDEADKRAREMAQFATEDRVKRDRTDIADLHREISELGGATDTIALATYHRVNARFTGILDDIEKEGAEEDRVIIELRELIQKELTSIESRLKITSASSDTRDYSKFVWAEGAHKEGKQTLIGLIAARFAQEQRVKNKAEFDKSFGAEVAQALGINRSEITPNLLLDEMDYHGQRDRYAQADRRLKERYGDDIVLTFEGKHYRGGWNVGVKGGRPAERQVKLIEYFKKKGYPIADA